MMNLVQIPLLETEHYILREPMIEDAKQLFLFMKDKDTMKYITPHPVTELEKMEEKLQAHLQGFQNEKEIPWVVTHRETGEIIGFFRLHKLNMWHRKAEMGTTIKKDYQQKGVMTEILRSIIPYCFEELNLNRLVGDIFSSNQGSQKLLERCGFHKDGVLRQTDFDGKEYHDTVVYSMLRSEYEQKKEFFL